MAILSRTLFLVGAVAGLAAAQTIQDNGKTVGMEYRHNRNLGYN